MNINRKFLLLGCGLFLVFLISQLPARLIFVLTPSYVAQGFSVEGTVWNGRARIINTGGQQLRNTEWDLALSRLLIGQIGLDFKTRWNGGFAEGFAAASFTGKVSLKNILASLDISILSGMINVPQLRGQASLNLTEAVIVDNWPQLLIGELEIRNMASPLMGGAPELIGNMAVSFDGVNTSDGALNGILRDTGGPLELNGSLKLSAPSAYDLNALVRPRPEAAKSLRDSLQFLGAPEPDGSYVFKLAGSL